MPVAVLTFYTRHLAGDASAPGWGLTAEVEGGTTEKLKR
jgi:hypothetical protein